MSHEGEKQVLSGWEYSSTIPPLTDGMVQVWRVRLDGPDRMQVLEAAYALLNAQERGRAAGMRSLRRREEFIAGRGTVRRLLGSILEVDPRAITLESGADGKPRLSVDRESNESPRSRAFSAIAETEVEFNVAHSGGVVLVALSGAGAIGVDVECVDPELEVVEVARTAFLREDVAGIEAAEDPLAEFYRCWTRQEAVGKADGRGLLVPAGGQDFYHVCEIETGDGFAAAVATERKVTRWLLLEWVA